MRLSMADEAALLLARRVILSVNPGERENFEAVARYQIGLARVPSHDTDANWILMGAALTWTLLPAVQHALRELSTRLIDAGVEHAEIRLATHLAGYPVTDPDLLLSLRDVQVIRQAVTDGASKVGLCGEAVRTLETVIERLTRQCDAARSV